MVDSEKLESYIGGVVGILNVFFSNITWFSNLHLVRKFFNQ